MKLVDRINGYKYVSFDIFGTLLVRNVKNVNDIFRITEKWLNKNGVNKDFWANNSFYDIRVSAQKMAFEKKGENYTLDDVYIFFPAIIRNEAMQAELLIEDKLIQPNSKVLKILKKVQDKKIVIISDMYLPYSFISGLLEKHGIKYYKLYISSELGLNKRSGSLFGHVLEDLGIQSTEIIHIGDGLNSDYLQPLKRGISAIRIKDRKALGSFSDDHVFENILVSYINHNLSTYDQLYKLGYAYLGPVILGFVLWLENRVNDDSVDKLVFLAREGQTLKRAYEKIQNTLGNSEYLEVSRRSLAALGILSVNSVEEMIPYLNLPHMVSLEAIAEQWDVPADIIPEELSDHMFDRNSLLKDSGSFEVLEKWFPIIKKRSYEQKELITQYLSRFFTDCKKIALVDVGWRGSMQSFLKNNEMLANKELIGYYLGLNREHKDSIEAHGYMFEDGDSKNEDMFMGAAGLIEVILFPDRGSVKEYQVQDGEIKPVYQKNELDEHSYSIVEKIQTGIFDFIDGISKIDINDIFELDKDIISKNFTDYISRPSFEAIRTFEKISFNNGIYVENLVGFESGVGYKVLLHNFANSGWKTGYLRKIFKVPLRYDRVYSLLRTMRH